MNQIPFVPASCGRWLRIANRTTRVLLCSVLTLASAATHASTGVVSLERLRFPAGASHELLAERMWIHGMPAQVLVFDVPQSPGALARALSAQQPALADLQVLPGQLILSGRVGDDRWVAQMEGVGAARTVGSISTVNARATPMAARPAWLPEGARVRMDVAVMEAGVKVSERIWQHALPPKRMAGLLEAGLHRAGWTREKDRDSVQTGALHTAAGQWWTRERERMRLWLVPVDAGSGLRTIGWAP